MCKYVCYICLWHDYEWNELMTLGDLVQACKESIYTLEDYSDRRKNTNITQFDFCPFCGEKIEWKKIRKISKAKFAES